MSDVAKSVSAITSGLVATVRSLVAVELALILFWTLIEITGSLLFGNTYPCLFILPLIAFVILALGSAESGTYGLTKVNTGSLNIMPLLLMDLILIGAAVWTSDQFGQPFTTPLLSFSQTLIHKLMS